MIPAAEREEAVAAYLNGASLNSIGRYFGVTRKTVAGWVWNVGHELRLVRGAERFQWRDAEMRRRAVAAYLGGASANEVGRRFGVDHKTVTRWVKTAGHEVRGSLNQSKFSVATRKLAVEAHLAGESLKTVAERFGASPGTISAWVHAAGHEVRAVDRHKLSREDRQRAVQSYLDGASSDEVGKQFGVDRTTVADWVKAAGLLFGVEY